MKRRFLFLMALAVWTVAATARVPHLLPRPQQITEKTGERHFVLGGGIVLNDPTQCALLRRVLEENGCHVTDRSRQRVEVRLVSGISGSYDYRLDGYENEAYRLDVAETAITIEAVTPTGVIRAAQTLQQLAEGYQQLAAVEAVEIVDWPAFKLRGFMHDTGRSFIPIEDLKHQLLLLSRFKVNTFHWHLTENQAWRFEVKSYPQLTSASSMTRHAGQFYTQDDCRELEEYAHELGITVIPEIDMPGHSAAFERAMGFGMQTAQGQSVLKTVLAELAGAFPRAPYLHIGTDETPITRPELIPAMVRWVHALGRKVVVWNPTNADPTQADMVQLWGTAGRLVKGRPNIDCRYNYLNHFDAFADVAAIYLSNIYYAPQGNEELAGEIAGIWNDHALPTPDDILRQNAFYPAVIASASRAWQGGGEGYIETQGVASLGRSLGVQEFRSVDNSSVHSESQGVTSTLLNSSTPTLPENGDFPDWEARFLFHKAHALKDEPIVYVKQSHVRWRITYKDKTYPATGAGVYLRHTWGDIIPAVLPKPEYGDAAYAYTRVFSPDSQKVGALIEFQNYSRSEQDSVPEYGRWDCKGSRIWLNGVEILAPIWRHHGQRVDNETPLADENMAARKPVILHLEKGWNTVYIELPWVPTPGIRLNKWMFTFVFTDPEGRRALDLDYDPEGE